MLHLKLDILPTSLILKLLFAEDSVILKQNRQFTTPILLSLFLTAVMIGN